MVQWKEAVAAAVEALNLSLILFFFKKRKELTNWWRLSAWTRSQAHGFMGQHLLHWIVQWPLPFTFNYPSLLSFFDFQLTRPNDLSLLKSQPFFKICGCQKQTTNIKFVIGLWARKIKHVLKFSKKFPSSFSCPNQSNSNFFFFFFLPPSKIFSRNESQTITL